jgi:hypothetical protein
LEELGETDKCSDHFLDLEFEKTNLRKRLIDLDYGHKLECANSIRQNRLREAEEMKKIEHQIEQQREQQKEQRKH